MIGKSCLIAQRVGHRLEDREVAEVGVREHRCPGPATPPARSRARGRSAGACGRTPRTAARPAPAARSAGSPRLNRFSASSIGLHGVVVALEEVLLVQVAVDVEQVADRLRGVVRQSPAARRSGRSSETPSTSKTSTLWYATTARPLSEMIVGCGTPASSQTLLMRKTTSLAYSCSV